jgi:hypothetical protein
VRIIVYKARSGSRTAGSVGVDLRDPASRPEFHYLAQDLKVRGSRYRHGIVTVKEKRDDKRIITLKTTVSNQRGEVIKRVDR